MVSLEVKVAEVTLELAETLVLDIGVTDGFLESAKKPLNSDVREVFETGATLVD